MYSIFHAHPNHSSSTTVEGDDVPLQMRHYETAITEQVLNVQTTGSVSDGL